MVTIKDDFKKNPLFEGFLSNYLIYLYEQFSQLPLPQYIKIPNDSWKECIHLLYKCNHQEDPEFIVDTTLVPPYDDIPLNTDKVLVGLSGGKDSASHVARLVDEGKKVTAYFMKKANISYTLEEDAAQSIADSLDVLLLKDELLKSGKSDFHDNPFKNQLILVRMLEWGLNHDCTVISLGECWDSISSDIADTQFNFTDSLDFIQAFEKALQSHVPSVRFDCMFENEVTDYSYIINKHPELIPHIISCVMPTRYLNIQRQQIEKYHIHGNPFVPDNEELLPGRCMACWKCMYEWILLVAWNKIPYNEEYFKNKVLPTLKKHEKELDSTFDNASVEDIMESLLKQEYLNKYLSDIKNIEGDIHHSYPELDREVGW